MSKETLDMAKAVAARVAEAGGRTFFVGGCVRDALMGVESKDVDIEVHGIPCDVLAEILSSLGELRTTGLSFGVYQLAHYDLDIAMPRRETAIGRGHRDFSVDVDPWIGTEKAAVRRDFTINAMMRDVLTDELIDHFGGREDLAHGILRHVADRSFVEDPLRVLRAAQFAARFSFRIAPETAALCRTMDLTALARERIFTEMEKALCKAPKPSVFFEALREMDQLGYWFPEVAALIGVEQNPVHHPEGDVYRHTMQVLDAAATLRDTAVHPLWLMLAALTHDFGKPATTEKINGTVHAYAHESAGIPCVRAFLDRLTSETDLRRYVLNLSEWHMAPNLYAVQNASKKAFMHLYDRCVCPEDLLLLAKADCLGRKTDREIAEREAITYPMLDEYRKLMEQPAVLGRDLVSLGFEPGPAFREALSYAHKLHLAGVGKEAALTQTVSYLKKEQKKNESR